MSEKNLIKSKEVLRQTDGGGTITVIRLSASAKEGLTTEGAVIPPPAATTETR